MKKRSIVIALLGFSSIGYGQNSINSSGTDVSGTGSVSYSLGQISTQTITGTGSLLQGVQISAEQFLVGLEDDLSISSLAIIYPNPTVENATLTLPSTEVNLSYRLLNSVGIELHKDMVSSIETTIPTSDLAAGIYYLQVIDKNNISKTFKIIKK